MQFRHFALTEDWGIAANVGAAYGAWTAQTWVMGDDGRIVTASPFAFSVPFVLTYQSKNHRSSFHLSSPQQATEVLRHDLPKFRRTDHDILAGLFSPSIRFHRL
jgi:hypothetical protein